MSNGEFIGRRADALYVRSLTHRTNELAAGLRAIRGGLDGDSQRQWCRRFDDLLTERGRLHADLMAMWEAEDTLDNLIKAGNWPLPGGRV